MLEPHLTLCSEDLLSKWGFNDGDDPEGWLVYCETVGIDYNEVDFPLAELVRKHLLPALDQIVTVVDIDTIHNPIRAERVNGVDVTCHWYGHTEGAPKLTPEQINIPMSEVARLVRR
ncbi:hypothetical protein ACIPPM_22075 [Streptomyces sp. NPDC090119]|uniref:hypothetical protein n=1 Tax=Streptomyces sp. NPDC090119 TaxID=3365951 RepID=UPI00382C67AC